MDVMAKRDYYEILGVGRDVSESELKSAFRKRAMKHHPDRNPGDSEAEARFKELAEAYEVLSNQQKRAAYDRFGHAAFEQAGSGQGPGGQGFSDFFSDFFDDVFKERRGHGQARPHGSDLRHDLELSLEEVFFGKTVEIRYAAASPCERCLGSGAEEGAKPSPCQTCNGVGRVHARQGFFTIERTCPACAGEGDIIDKPCRSCNGHGTVRTQQTVSVDVPVGIEDGQRMRLSGKGEAGIRGGPRGDLYIFLSVKPHPIFQRKGRDLLLQVPIPMTNAALGSMIEVPVIDGRQIEVRIPEGSETGDRLRVRGRGMPSLKGSEATRGDLFIELDVEMNKNLDKRQRELLKEFQERSVSQSDCLRSVKFRDRVRSFLRTSASTKT